jgi:hypothetical protein
MMKKPIVMGFLVRWCPFGPALPPSALSLPNGGDRTGTFIAFNYYL